MSNRNQETEPGVIDPEVDPQQIGIDEALEQEDPAEPDLTSPEVEPGDEDLAMARAIAEMDATDRERLAQALEVIAATRPEPPSREGITAGDYVELMGHAYVKFPDGTVVTSARQILLGQPGEYHVRYWGTDVEETFTVAEKDADA